MAALVENNKNSWSNSSDYLIMANSEFCAPQHDEELEGFVSSFQNCLKVLDRIFAYAA